MMIDPITGREAGAKGGQGGSAQRKGVFFNGNNTGPEAGAKGVPGEQRPTAKAFFRILC